jgi:surface antigen
MESPEERIRRLQEENRRRNAETQRQWERHQDRQDEERRHRERMAAMSEASSSGTYGNSADTSSVRSGGRLSSKALFALVAVVAASFLIIRPASDPSSRTNSADEISSSLQSSQEEQAFNSSDATVSTLDSQPAERTPESMSPRKTKVATEVDLRGPILRALDSGQAVAWEGNGNRGFVTVSAPVQSSGKTCRAVQITGAAASTATTRWCRTEDKDWAAE